MTRLYKPLLDELNLTYPQYLAMLVLWEHEKIGFRDLGKLLQLKTGTLTPIIQRLEKIGYVAKEKDPDDDRKAYVLLTEKGREIFPEAKEIPNKLAKAMNLTHQEYLEYVEGLDKMTKSLMDAKF
jgi:DNA-binding MarR family transcriptional regulator